MSDKKPGKILRVKTGYNPNSSSVGSHIPAFLAFATGSGALTVFIMNLLNSINKRIRGEKQKLDSTTEGK